MTVLTIFNTFATHLCKIIELYWKLAKKVFKKLLQEYIVNYFLFLENIILRIIKNISSLQNIRYSIRIKLTYKLINFKWNLSFFLFLASTYIKVIGYSHFTFLLLSSLKTNKNFCFYHIFSSFLHFLLRKLSSYVENYQILLIPFKSRTIRIAATIQLLKKYLYLFLCNYKIGLTQLSCYTNLQCYK